MNKKPFLIVLLFCVCLLLLAACSGASPEPAPEPSPEPTPGALTTGPARGVWDGQVYTNDSLGLQMSLPEYWEIATDEEIAELFGIVAELGGGLLPVGDLWDALELLNVIDALAIDFATGANINIIFERLVFPMTRLTGQDYVELVVSQYEAVGTQVNEDRTGTVHQLGDRQWYMVSYTTAAFGFGPAGHGLQLINVEDGFVVVITITYYDNSASGDEILTWFS